MPVLGRRRGWMLLTQAGLLVAIASLGGFSPQADLRVIAVLSTMVAFLSATQDIAIDAYRRELLSDHELGLGNAVHVNAYRIAGLVPGSLSLILADILPWNLVFIDHRPVHPARHGDDPAGAGAAPRQSAQDAARGGRRAVP